MKICEKLLDYVYPTRCPVCQDIVSPRGLLVCRECENKLKLVTEPFCLKCGRPLESETTDMCPYCLNMNHSFTRGRSLYLYDEVVKSGLYAFKYGGRKEYGTFYGTQIALNLSDFIIKNDVEAIIPIPLHARRMMERGYNQAAVIAQTVSLITTIPCLDDYLIRIVNTRTQKSLNGFRRKQNLNRAFQINQKYLRKNMKSVLIIDDIYTTGSTIDSASEILKNSGIENVYFIVIAIGYI